MKNRSLYVAIFVVGVFLYSKNCFTLQSLKLAMGSGASLAELMKQKIPQKPGGREVLLKNKEFLEKLKKAQIGQLQLKEAEAQIEKWAEEDRALRRKYQSDKAIIRRLQEEAERKRHERKQELEGQEAEIFPRDWRYWDY